jgi:peptidoglycan biosynthesis protein MviN/MurJ (putative lipid II flippase)
VYQRGSFTSIESGIVSSIFFIICFAILPWSINQILSRTFYVQENFWFPVVSGTSVTLITILYMTQIKNPSSLDFALIIVISLYAYSIILLLKLTIDGEKLLDKGLIVDFIKTALILSVSYFAVQTINISNSIFSLFVSLIAISFVVFVLLKLLKFKYINLTGRE